MPQERVMEAACDPHPLGRTKYESSNCFWQKPRQFAIYSKIKCGSKGLIPRPLSNAPLGYRNNPIFFRDSGCYINECPLSSRDPSFPRSGFSQLTPITAHFYPNCNTVEEVLMIATKENQSNSPEAVSSTEKPTREATRPALEDVVSLIRQDATKSALTYLMRSNTAHDGE